MKRSAFAVAVACVAAGSTAGAQVSPLTSPIHVGVSVGATVPISDAAKSTGGEPALESKVGYHVNGLLEFSVPVVPIGLRAEFLYHDLKGKEQRVEDPNFGTITGRGDNRVMGGTLNALFQGGGIATKPYVIAGVGVYNLQTTINASATNFGSVSFKDKSTDFGLNGGVGIRFPLAGFSTFAEARYHYILNKQDCTNSTSDTCVDRDNTSIIPISFGIMF